MRVFISYAWENPSYRRRVASLCERLCADGVDVRFDEWHIEGVSFPEFMSRETRLADKILVLCSPLYRTKVHELEEGRGISGAGWETMLITTKIFTTRDRKAIIPVWMHGDWNMAAPDYLFAVPRINFADPAVSEMDYNRLLAQLFDLGPKQPDLGVRSPSTFQNTSALAYRERIAAEDGNGGTHGNTTTTDSLLATVEVRSTERIIYSVNVDGRLASKVSRRERAVFEVKCGTRSLQVDYMDLVPRGPQTPSYWESGRSELLTLELSPGHWQFECGTTETFWTSIFKSPSTPHRLYLRLLNHWNPHQ